MKKIALVVFASICAVIASNANPTLSFFNEMKSQALVQLFKDTSVIENLQKLHAQVRMGILDLTDERAQVVKDLNNAGVPVVAWLLLPEEQGYWFNSGNGQEAIARYKEIKQWADNHKLQFSGIGLDLELDFNDAKLIRTHPWKLVAKIPARLFDKSEIEKGRKEYATLIRLIKADKYPVESYYASFIKDEVNLHQTAIQQVSKFLDIKTDKEIPMLYSSFMGNADGLIKIYGIDLKLNAVALGSTGGGVDTTLPTLSYEQLVHDINVAAKQSTEIHIFSLEGCVSKGYLTKLVDYTYDSTVTLDPKQIKSVSKLQTAVKRVSTILSYPVSLFSVIILIVVFIIWVLYVLLRFIIRKLID